MSFVSRKSSMLCIILSETSFVSKQGPMLICFNQEVPPRPNLHFELSQISKEVISYCRQNNFDGVLVRDAEYAIFAAAKSPPRLFSASAFKLSFKKQISTSEFLLDNLAKALNLHPDRFPLLGALLGNHILTSDDLRAFQRALINGGDPKVAKPKILVEKVADFVRRLPQADDWQVGRYLTRMRIGRQDGSSDSKSL